MSDPIRGVSPAASSQVGQTGTLGTPTPTQTNTPTAPAASSVDSADIARAEALLASISAAMNTVPPVDQTRVAELQQQLKNGVYQANPQQIAEKMSEIEALLVH